MRASIFRKVACTSLLLVSTLSPEGVYSTGVKASANLTTQQHNQQHKIQVQAKDTYNSFNNDDDVFLQKQKYVIINERLSEQRKQREQNNTSVVPSGADQVSHIIESASKKYNVPVTLLYAQAYTESKFNPNATGTLGDVGLFQILPSTAYAINDAHFKIEGFHPSMLYNPSLNADFAGWYLTYLHEKTDTWEETLTAYNLGLGGLHKHQRVYGSSDSDYYERICSSHETLFGNHLFN